MLSAPLHRSNDQIPPIPPLPTHEDRQIHLRSSFPCNATLHLRVKTSWWPRLHWPCPREPCPDHRSRHEDLKFPRPDCVNCCQAWTQTNRPFRCPVWHYFLPSILFPLQYPWPVITTTDFLFRVDCKNCCIFLDIGEDIGKPLPGPVGPSGEIIGGFIDSINKNHVPFSKLVFETKQISVGNRQYVLKLPVV